MSAADARPTGLLLDTGPLFTWSLLQVEVIKKAYMQGEVEFEDGENGEDGAASPRNVGHNIYILGHQVGPLPAYWTHLPLLPSPQLTGPPACFSTPAVTQASLCSGQELPPMC